MPPTETLENPPVIIKYNTKHNENALSFLEHDLFLAHEKEVEVEAASSKAKTFVCGICFVESERSEKNYAQIVCSEHQEFCNDCIKTHLTWIVKNNPLATLSCPGNKCRSYIPKENCHMLKEIVDEETFEFFDAKITEKCISEMREMVWCPEKACSSPVLVIMSRKDTQCSKCHITFCWKCLRKTHYGRCTKKSPVVLMDEETVKYIKSTTRPCPQCQIQIEKNGGCDHMYCIRCNFHFNWSGTQTNVLLQPFEVDKNRNVLKGTLAKDRQKLMIRLKDLCAENPEPKQNCPNCSEKNTKNGTSNHVSCSNCATKFCFICGDFARSTSHFSKLHNPQGTCLQHSSQELTSQLIQKHSTKPKHKHQNQKQKHHFQIDSDFDDSDLDDLN